MAVTAAYRGRFAFAPVAFLRPRLIEKLDEIGRTLARDSRISDFEDQVAQHRPWIAGRCGYEGIVVEDAGRT